ncbi:hypothetical protein AKO1_013176 [Acrasis kona]|uniref:Fatty acid hydroxylase domain-containing protein n=1 Tax=Acrasis kona TaxID=1008807 RepID=A0AAW2YY97_9EUKA
MDALVDTRQGKKDALDPEIPLLDMIDRVGERYQAWVHKPHFHSKSLYLFAKSGFLEFNSHMSWYLIPAFWTPFFIYHMYKAYSYNNLSIWFYPFAILLSQFSWGILEYSLHRWAFHAKTNHWITNRLHFIFHGVHHLTPMDTERLVFPPIPGYILIYTPARLFFGLFLTNMTFFHLFLGFGIVAYICYDLTHYYIHHGRKVGGIFKYLKETHNHHHFAANGEESNFGVSLNGKVIDYILRTNVDPTESKQ